MESLICSSEKVFKWGCVRIAEYKTLEKRLYAGNFSLKLKFYFSVASMIWVLAYLSLVAYSLENNNKDLPISRHGKSKKVEPILLNGLKLFPSRREGPIKLPLILDNSRQSSTQGEYLVRMEIGSDHKMETLLILDTGSDISWVRDFPLRGADDLRGIEFPSALSSAFFRNSIYRSTESTTVFQTDRTMSIDYQDNTGIIGNLSSEIFGSLGSRIFANVQDKKGSVMPSCLGTLGMDITALTPDKFPYSFFNGLVPRSGGSIVISTFRDSTNGELEIGNDLSLFGKCRKSNPKIWSVQVAKDSKKWQASLLSVHLRKKDGSEVSVFSHDTINEQRNLAEFDTGANAIYIPDYVYNDIYAKLTEILQASTMVAFQPEGFAQKLPFEEWPDLVFRFSDGGELVVLASEYQSYVSDEHFAVNIRKSDKNNWLIGTPALMSKAMRFDAKDKIVSFCEGPLVNESLNNGVFELTMIKKGTCLNMQIIIGTVPEDICFKLGNGLVVVDYDTATRLPRMFRRLFRSSEKKTGDAIFEIGSFKWIQPFTINSTKPSTVQIGTGSDVSILKMLKKQAGLHETFTIIADGSDKVKAFFGWRPSIQSMNKHFKCQKPFSETQLFSEKDSWYLKTENGKKVYTTIDPGPSAYGPSMPIYLKGSTEPLTVAHDIRSTEYKLDLQSYLNKVVSWDFDMKIFRFCDNH